MADEEDDEKRHITEGVCPVCGKKLKHVEGCVECVACGWSRCVEA